MIVFGIFILCSVIWSPGFAYDGWYSAGNLVIRLENLMDSYYEESTRKIAAIHYIRFSYENSAYYETGYIMGEIIESYRKMVEHVKRPIQFKSDALMETLLRIQFIQGLYFEVYHLVHMMHEIPRKYGRSDDVEVNTDQAVYSNETAINAQETIEKNKTIRDQQKKKRLKDMKKIRELYLKGQYLSSSSVGPPSNKWWPIDYGWEIDYYWP